MKKMILGVAMLFALTTIGFAQSVTNFNITDKMVIDAQKGWCGALIQISETKDKGGDYKKLASDIIDKGIVMSGGTSLLRNLDKLFTESLGVPAALAENPLLCVALGTGLALENLDLYKRSVSKR